MGGRQVSLSEMGVRHPTRQPLWGSSVHRGTVAVVLGAGLGLAACGVAAQPGPADTGVVDRVTTSTPAVPRSACVDTPAQGVSSVMVDWVDFVQLGGIQYVAARQGQPETVPSGDLGGVLG